MDISKLQRFFTMLEEKKLTGSIRLKTKKHCMFENGYNTTLE